MSGLASLFRGLGHHVSGSDRVTTAETERMVGNGLKFWSPQTAEAVEGVDVVVYSSAIKPGNPEYDRAIEQNTPLLRRAEALAFIMEKMKGIVVAGTHGKTTTSAMGAHILRGAGLAPSHYVGAEIPILGRNALWEDGSDWFIAEGDESDGTLVNFHTEWGILLNVEAEHLDHYTGGIEQIRGVFRQFVDQARAGVVYCGEDANARRVCSEHPNAVSYGWTNDCDYYAESLSAKDAGTYFMAFGRGGKKLGVARLGIPGRHNVLNSLAIIALATEIGVPFENIEGALETFRGAKRRFEAKRMSPRVTIIDDYGHHPTEILATIATARSQHAGRLICAFQPHRYTRTKLLREEFGAAFDDVDELWVTDIYPASEPPLEGITGQTIVDAVKQRGETTDVFSHPDLGTLHLELGNKLQPGDWLITLGAGNIHEVGTHLADDLKTADDIRAAVGEERPSLRLYEPMRKHTTMKAGGPAQFWIEPQTIQGMQNLVKYCHENDIPLRVIGRGSNLLVKDGGIKGVVACLSKGEFLKLDVEGNQITAGGGVKLKALASAAQSAGIGHMEWMEGVPGAVGGSLRMNAGAMGAEMFDHVVSVTAITPEGELRTFLPEELDVNYRKVSELVDHIAVEAVFTDKPAPASEIAERMEASRTKRKESQPIAACSGCIFKNPDEVPAGMLVDQLGLKDFGIGSARVSEVHANFIVNDNGDATATQVLELIDRIQKTAKSERGIDLHTEVQIVGEDVGAF